MEKYKIEFKCRTLGQKLIPVEYGRSSMIIQLDHPVAFPFEVDWVSMVANLYPEFFDIELLNVKVVIEKTPSNVN